MGCAFNKPPQNDVPVWVTSVIWQNTRFAPGMIIPISIKDALGALHAAGKNLGSGASVAGDSHARRPLQPAAYLLG